MKFSHLFRVALVAVGALVGVTLGPVIPVAKFPISGVAQADWVRYELPAPTMIGDKLWPAGTETCKDKDTGVLYPPSPYSDKSRASQATVVCTAMMPFLAWLGTAEAAPVLSHTLVNPDGSHSTAWPQDGKPPTAISLSFSASACATALAPIANLTTSDTVAINLDSACTAGTDRGSATLTIDATASAANFSITGSYPNRTLSRASGTAGTGSMVLNLTYMGTTALSSTSPGTAYPWSVVAPPATDSLATPIPKNLVATPGTGTVVLTGDVPWDACGNQACKGTQDIQIQRDGSGTLATVTTGPGPNCNPTSTNIGTATSVSVTQSGNDWTVSSNGANDGASDQYEFVNCAIAGAGFVDLIVNSFSGDTSDVRHACVEHRAVQSDPGSITVRACILQDIGGGAYYFGASRRLTANAATTNGNFVAVTVPACVRISWDASNLNSAGYATSAGGKCNNDFTVQYSTTLAMPATSYAGWHVTSNNGGGSSSTAVLKQVNISNSDLDVHRYDRDQSHVRGASSGQGIDPQRLGLLAHRDRHPGRVGRSDDQVSRGLLRGLLDRGAGCGFRHHTRQRAIPGDEVVHRLLRCADQRQGRVDNFQLGEP
jgi:hypothetical protein